MSSEELPNRKVAFENEMDEDDEVYMDESDEDDEEEEEEEEDDELIDLLSNTLVTPEGETLCGTLVKISDTLETQNKIMIKLLTAIAKRA